MDITMIGLQNAGKTSLLRVLAVGPDACFDLCSELTRGSRAVNLRSSMVDISYELCLIILTRTARYLR